LFIRSGRPLKYLDPLLLDHLEKFLAHSGVTIRSGAVPASIEEEGGSKTMVLQDGHKETFDEILFAAGRVPVTKGLGLDAAGVNVGEKGYITVDEYQNTSAGGVYALGDNCGKVELTPMAIAAGRRLADRIFGGMADAKADYSDVPTVIFSHPTIGTIGLSEPDARAKHGDAVRVYTSTFVNLFYGPFAMDPSEKPKTAMKVVCVGPEEKVVGIHIIGMAADEMLQGFGVAMKMGMTKADLDRCVAIHPVAAEELVTLPPWGLKNDPKPPS
jgi:glutathione reductase (NADPH)